MPNARHGTEGSLESLLELESLRGVEHSPDGKLKLKGHPPSDSPDADAQFKKLESARPKSRDAFERFVALRTTNQTMVYVFVAGLFMLAALACGRSLQRRHRRLKRIRELRDTLRRVSW